MYDYLLKTKSDESRMREQDFMTSHGLLDNFQED